MVSAGTIYGDYGPDSTEASATQAHELLNYRRRPATAIMEPPPPASLAAVSEIGVMVHVQSATRAEKSARSDTEERVERTTGHDHVMRVRGIERPWPLPLDAETSAGLFLFAAGSERGARSISGAESEHEHVNSAGLKFKPDT